MRSNGLSDGLISFFCVFVACVMCLFIGDAAAGIKFRREAVKAGVAEWRSDARGQPVFMWKRPINDE